MARRVRAVREPPIAMVQPAPRVPSGKPDQPLGTTVQLAKLLQMIGNDRAYTVINHEGNVWTLMFEGDYAPTVLRFEGEKPEVT